MGISFNPIGENDWQGLNIVLEQLFYQQGGAPVTGSLKSASPTEETSFDASGEYVDGYIDDDPEEEITEPIPPSPGETPTRRELRKQKRAERKAARKEKKAARIANREAKRTKNIELDSSLAYPDGTPSVPMTSAVTVGGEVYNLDSPNENVTLPYKGTVYNTLAGISIPSSYYLDLRGIYKTAATQQYTADYLTLHNSSGLNMALVDIDETNTVTTAGPIAGGRDQADAFTASTWVHFFIIYNPTTKEVSSLSSASPTAPTLPTGFTYFVRVGCVWFTAGSVILRSYQMNDKVTYNVQWPVWDSHAAATDSIDISSFVPATAKLVHGIIGLTSGATPRKMFISADVGATTRVGAICDSAGTGDTGYGLSGSKDFTLPLITAQTIWWNTETTGDNYSVGIVGFTDDL